MIQWEKKQKTLVEVNRTKQSWNISGEDYWCISAYYCFIQLYYLTKKSLTFNFLKDDQTQNIIEQKVQEIMWTPKVQFLVLKDQASQPYPPSQTTVIKEGVSIMSADIDSLHPNESYKGNKKKHSSGNNSPKLIYLQLWNNPLSFW